MKHKWISHLDLVPIILRYLVISKIKKNEIRETSSPKHFGQGMLSLYYHRSCLERLSKTMSPPPVRTAILQAEIWTWNLTNTKQEFYPSTLKLGMKNIKLIHMDEIITAINTLPNTTHTGKYFSIIYTPLWKKWTCHFIKYYLKIT
jgi:hypothetical protein